MLVQGRIPRGVSTRFFPRLSSALQAVVPRLHKGIVSVSFVPVDEMTRLNALYRGKVQPTDILSFQYSERGNDRNRSKNPPAHELERGEIILCLPVVRVRARERGHTVSEEIERLIIHGVLHIAGHSHAQEGDAQKMEALEERVYRKLHSL